MLKEKSFYREGLPINITVANITEYPIHFHEDIEVVYILEGSVILKNGYYSFLLKQGDIFLLNDKEVHSFYKTEEDNMIMMMQLDVEYFAQYHEDFRNCFFVTNVNDENDESLEVLRNILARILMEVLQKESKYEHRVIENAHNLISCLLSDFQYFSIENGRFVNEAKNKGNKVLAGRLRRITDYMYENYTRKLTLSEIAQREHLSVFYLSHAIKEATGMSFQSLLSFIRVEESEKLLLGTKKKIGAISEECGFSAVRYYIKHFQTWFGMPPLEYRKKYARKVSSPGSKITYERCSLKAIEEAVRRQAKGVYNAYARANKPDTRIVSLDIAESLAERHHKHLFPHNLFEREGMKVIARPYTLFKNLNEQILLSESRCMISTTSAATASGLVNNLSILVYNYNEEFQSKAMKIVDKNSFAELIKGFDTEVEMLIRCIGLSGNFRVVRYKMTRENAFSACDEWLRETGTLNKRQALLNSWRSVPNIEMGEITVSDALNLRLILHGISAELILIDRQ